MKSVKFDRTELMLLEYKLAPSEVSHEKSEGQLLPASVPAKELVLKLGSALLQVLDGTQEVEISLSEQECWILRERVSIFESCGGRTDVGIAIKRKLYQTLLGFDTDRQIGEIAIVQQEEKQAREVWNALASRNGNTHQDNAED